MKNITKTITALFLLLSVSMVNAGYAEGKRAYDNNDYSTALTELKPLAEQGDAASQRNLGWMYANGKGVTKDYKQAVKCWTKAAEQGDATSQYNLGWMYANGHGVKKNTVLAIQYYRMAEKKGNKKAGLNINKLLLDRVDIEPWSKTIQEESYAWTFDYISSYVKSTNSSNLS
jgi:TPR repeat protein